MRFVLTTDSAGDLPLSYYKTKNLPFIPITYTLNGKTLPDDAGQSSSIVEFYEKVRAGAVSTTSMINPDAYTNFFEPFLKSGQDVLYIAFSSGLSGSCQSAVSAAAELSARYPERRIEVVDGLCASLGQGLFLDFCVKKREEGASLDEVRDWAEHNKLRMNHFVTVSDLMHLHRGGRVSKTSAVMGTLVGIKPMIYVNQEGRLIPDGKVRGRRGALAALVDRMEEYVDENSLKSIAISHGNCEEDALYVLSLIRERYSVGEVILNMIGPVIGSHSGPGTVALFFMGKTRKK